MLNTKYAREVVPPVQIRESKIERIFIKELQQEEIRFSWWKDGRFQTRPLDLPESELLPLLLLAFERGVLSEKFKNDLITALSK